MICTNKDLDGIFDIAEKETAKAILQAFYQEFVKYACSNDYYTSGDIEAIINDLAKEYDVEVER